MSNLARNLTRTINDQVVLESVLEEEKAWNRGGRRGDKRRGKSPQICTPEDLIRLNQTKEFTLICTSILHTVLKDRAFMAKSKDVWQYLYGLSRFKETLTIHISNQTLAIHMGCSVRTIQRYVRFLMGYGYLNRKASYQSRGEVIHIFSIVAPEEIAKRAQQTKDRKSVHPPFKLPPQLPHSKLSPIKQRGGRESASWVVAEQSSSSSLHSKPTLSSDSSNFSNSPQAYSCSKSDRNDNTDADSLYIYNKINNNTIPRLEKRESSPEIQEDQSVVFSSFSSKCKNLKNVNQNEEINVHGAQKKKDRKSLGGLKQDHQDKCDQDGVACLELQDDLHSLSCQDNDITAFKESKVSPKASNKTSKELKEFSHPISFKASLLKTKKENLEQHIAQLRARKTEYNQVFLNETNQTKKFEALQALGQAESAYERAVSKLEQLENKIQEQKREQAIQSHLQTNPYFIAEKEGNRQVSHFTVKRILKTLREYGYSENLSIEITNEIVFESRFGSLVKNNQNGQENGVDRSVNIGMKLVREGRWSTPVFLRRKGEEKIRSVAE